MPSGMMPQVHAMTIRRRRQGDEPRAIRPDDAHPVLQGEFDAVRRIRDGNAFGDDDDQFDARLDGLHDGVLGETGRHEYHAALRAVAVRASAQVAYTRNLRISALSCAGEGDRGAGLARVDAAHDVGAGLEHAGGMRHALVSGSCLGR